MESTLNPPQVNGIQNIVVMESKTKKRGVARFHCWDWEGEGLCRDVVVRRRSCSNSAASKAILQAVLSGSAPCPFPASAWEPHLCLHTEHCKSFRV